MIAEAQPPDTWAMTMQLTDDLTKPVQRAYPYWYERYRLRGKR